jgi:hypothetical protein
MNNDSRTDRPSITEEDQTPAPPAGPTDHGGKGGMATREVAPDIAEPDEPTQPG